MKINLSHGNGGRETTKLINEIFVKHFSNPILDKMMDASILNATEKIAFTTDSFVIKPTFFPGGNIGKLAVCGSVNDILTSMSIPKFLSVGFIIQEGVDFADLEKIAKSMAEMAKEAGVKIVTADTKVIDGDGEIYINTSAIGYVNDKIKKIKAKEEDVIIITGNIGDHHACIMSQRLGIENNIISDVAPLNSIVNTLVKNEVPVKIMRDITRGGLGTVLNELSNALGLQMEIEEEKLPVSKDVRGICDILGLDPLYMANEGKMVFITSRERAEEAVKAIKKTKYGKDAKIIGVVKSGNGVVLKTKLGGRRIVNVLTGENLPRIC